MRALTAIFQELVSVFVDDGRLAVVILIWITFYGLLLRLLPAGLLTRPDPVNRTGVHSRRECAPRRHGRLRLSASC
jgi:hypothetical protein